MDNQVAFNYVMEEMGMNKSKAKGTKVETTLVNYLKDAGFPDARRKPPTGSLDKGDVDLTVHPLIIAECKYASGTHGVKLTQWMRELDAEVTNSGATFGLLVAKQAGAGDKAVGRWVAACSVNHYAQISAISPIMPRPMGLWSSCPGNAVPGSLINGKRGWVEQLINQGTHELDPADWCLGRYGYGVGWRCITQQSAWTADSTTENFIVGPLWRFLRALRWAGHGESLIHPGQG